MIRKKAQRPGKAVETSTVRVHTLEVMLLADHGADRDGQAAAMSRTIQMRGDQLLADLHRALCDAADPESEQAYEFQFGREPKDPEGPRFVLPGAYEISVEDGKPAAGRVDQTTLDSLGLEVGDRFTYWIDCGDDLWHQVSVTRIEDRVPRGKFPKVTRRVGQLPPGRVDDPGQPHPMGPTEAADAACLVGELHLRKGDYLKAIDAFSRAIEEHATADAHEGRANAYRGLADADDAAAEKLR